MTLPTRAPLRAARAAVVTVASALMLAGCMTTADPVDLPDATAFEDEILDQINALRLADGVGRVTANDCLADHARDRATQLPGAVDVPREELPADCGDYDYAGENVSRSDQTAAQVVATWAAEPTQAPNLTDALFEVAGVGCVPVAAADTTRVAEAGEEVAGMACSVIFQGYSE